MSLPNWARAEAERLLVPLGRRWAHVRGVAECARSISGAVPPQQRALLVAAAYLHDIGYAPSLANHGFHPLDGALYLRHLGQERLARLVAHHSEAAFEAKERGLEAELADFKPEGGRLLDALTYADMTTGPDGKPVTAAERLDEILTRYSPGDPVHTAMTLARPHLKARVRRVELLVGRNSGRETTQS